MGIFVKKPVEVEARLYDGTDAMSKEIVAWITENQQEASYYCIDDLNCDRGDHKIVITTLEGNMFAMPGDYVIKGVRDEFYPCKGDIFAETYDAVSK